MATPAPSACGWRWSCPSTSPPSPPAHPPAQLLARPGAALAPPSDAAVSGIDATLGVLDTSPTSTVPITLEASPLTVPIAWQQSGHPSIVTGLAAVAGDPSVQFLSPPVRAGQCLRPGRRRAGHRVGPAGLPRGPSLAATVTHPGRLGGDLRPRGLDHQRPARPGHHHPAGERGLQPGGPSLGQRLLATGRWLDRRTFPAAHRTRSSGDGHHLQRRPVRPVHRVAGDAGTGRPPVARRVGPDLLREAQRLHPRMVVAVAPNGWNDNSAFVPPCCPELVDNPIIEPVTTNPVRHVRPGRRLPRRLPTAGRRLGCGSAGRRHPHPAPADRRVCLRRPWGVGPDHLGRARRPGAGQPVGGPPPHPAERAAREHRRQP